MGKSLEKRKPPVGLQPQLDKYGESLLEKVVAAEGPGAAGAQAHLYRTLVEFTVPKPELHLDMNGFKGDISIKIEGVD